jgi:hypothetical protein
MQWRFYEEIEAWRCKNGSKQQVADCGIISTGYVSLTIAPTTPQVIYSG